ncbi:MAG: AbrB/MazE/SpoVT family DNA-binding domain-containing protein [Pirellulales bacterium]
MKTSITKIGNSKGIIIPAHLLKQCELTEKVSLEVKDQTLIISNAKSPRQGWEEAFVRAGAGDEELLADEFINEFDQGEWTW